MTSIAIFGGTFDPVHQGHLQTSINIQQQFHFDAYYFLPCKIPALKAPSLANNQQRIEMLKLALSDHPQFSIDLREIERDTPSYMVETLKSIRSQYPDAAITLIMGYDAFRSLPLWHEWQSLIKLANLLIINREQQEQLECVTELNTLLKMHETMQQEDLLNNNEGFIYFFNAGDYPISSTEIRTKLKLRQKVTDLLPAEVYQYIKKWNLYQ